MTGGVVRWLRYLANPPTWDLRYENTLRELVEDVRDGDGGSGALGPVWGAWVVALGSVALGFCVVPGRGRRNAATVRG